MLFFYEDMVRDVPATVAAVATFLGVALTPAELDVVAERASFAWMKKHGKLFDVGSSTPLAGEGTMVRAGAAAHGASLCDAERDEIDDAMRAALIALNSDFPYDERYGRVRRNQNTKPNEMK